MRFAYLPFEVTSALAPSGVDVIYRPVIPVRWIAAAGEMRRDSLLDTGV